MNSIVKKTTLFVLGISLLVSCNPMKKTQLANVSVQKKQDVIVASDNLKNFLSARQKSNQSLSVVLRTPQTATANITQGQVVSKEQTWLNKVYDALEQALILNGFDVKDRAMVNNVLNNINTTASDQKSGDVFDYAKIGKVLNVDLFIEITTPPRFLYEQPNIYRIKEFNSPMETRNALNVAYIEFVYRFVIAETGSVGGMFKVYQQACLDGGCDFYILQQSGQPTKFQETKYAGSNMFASKLSFFFVTPEDQIASFFANQLVNYLKNK